MKLVLRICFLGFLSGLAYGQANQPQLVNWFVGADIVGATNSEEELGSDLTVREFEISANSFIDHIWQGSLTLSQHSEPGDDHESAPEIHEAFIFSNSVIEQGHLKLGKFFLGFGRLNRFHRHDWTFTEAPYYHQQFFGSEGVKDTGIEYAKLLSSEKYIKLTVGLTEGQEFVHSHDHDEDEEEEEHNHSENPHVPTHYLRLSSFHEFETTRGFEYGLNYVGRTDAEGIKYAYAGLDFIYKERIQKYIANLFQMEVWHRNTHEAGEDHKDLGVYAYYEHGFDQNHSLGLKVEYFKPHEEEHEDGDEEHEHGTEIDEQYTEVGVSYIYNNSEFLKTRLTISQSNGLVIDEEEVSNTKGLLQLIFNIGAHPAHLY